MADFGLSVAKDSRPVQMTMMSSGGTSGTTRWNAPELMPDMDSLEDESDTKRPNAASDVYAFAMVCYEASSQYNRKYIHIFIDISYTRCSRGGFRSKR